MTASIYLDPEQITISLAASGEQGTDLDLYDVDSPMSVRADQYQLIDSDPAERVHLLVESNGETIGVQMIAGDDEIKAFIGHDPDGRPQISIAGSAFDAAVNRALMQRIEELTRALRTTQV